MGRPVINKKLITTTEKFLAMCKDNFLTEYVAHVPLYPGIVIPAVLMVFRYASCLFHLKASVYDIPYTGHAECLENWK